MLVDAVLDTSTNTITITDSDTNPTITADAFTGGKVNPDGTITPGTAPPYTPAPKGDYIIVDNPNPGPGKEDWYGLFKDDDRIDDYFDDNGTQRGGVRLHKGGISHGCVTVSKEQDQAEELWRKIRDAIAKTKTENQQFIKGPHWWNGTGSTTKYGTLTIK
jgi:hypothetical protein